MKRITKKKLRCPVDFWSYFNVADEIYPALVMKRYMDKPTTEVGIMTGSEPGLTLADLSAEAVEAAHRWAEQNGAPWPPYLPWAEEYSNDLAMKEARDARANRA